MKPKLKLKPIIKQYKKTYQTTESMSSTIPKGIKFEFVKPNATRK